MATTQDCMYVCMYNEAGQKQIMIVNKRAKDEEWRCDMPKLITTRLYRHVKLIIDTRVCVFRYSTETESWKDLNRNLRNGISLIARDTSLIK